MPATLGAEKVLKELQDALPAGTVVFTGFGLVGESAVGDANECAGFGGCEFPADDGGMRRMLVPVGKPGPDEQARRIDFEDFAVTFEDHLPVLVELFGDWAEIFTPLGVQL